MFKYFDESDEWNSKSLALCESVQIQRVFSGPYFPVFGLNIESEKYEKKSAVMVIIIQTIFWYNLSSQIIY